MKTLKNHPAVSLYNVVWMNYLDPFIQVVPVFVITCFGAAMATLQILRSANVYSDVS